MRRGRKVWAAVWAAGLGFGGAAQGSLVITGVVDGGLAGGLPKGVELAAVADVPDLSRYGLGVANNGGGTDGVEFVFPAGTLNAGSFVRVASEQESWAAVFGSEPDFVSGAVGINGDDAIELYYDGQVIDVFGNVEGSAVEGGWYYGDAYAYRVNGTGADGPVYAPDHWRFGGARELNGVDANGHAVALRGVFGLYTPPGGTGPVRLLLAVEPGRVREDSGPEALRIWVGCEGVPSEGLVVRFRAEGPGAPRLALPGEGVLTVENSELERMGGVIEDPAPGGELEAVLWAEAAGAVPAAATLLIEDVTPRPAMIVAEVFPVSSTGDPNGDGESNYDDEFVEVVNASDSTVDLAGWSLWSFGDVTELTKRHTFPASTALLPGGGLVVFQGLEPGTPEHRFGGAVSQAASSGLLYLADGGDTVVLRDPWGVSVDALVYGTEDAAPGVSLVPGAGGGTVEVLRHDALPAALGAAYSPGTTVAGVSYPGVLDRLIVVLEAAELAERNDLGLPWETRGVVERIGPSGYEESLAVRLEVEDAEELEVEPGGLILATGERKAEFWLRAKSDEKPDGDAKAIGVTATAERFIAGRAEIDVIDLQLDVLRVEVDSAEIWEGGEAGVLRVTLVDLLGGLPRADGPEVVLEAVEPGGEVGIRLDRPLIVPAGEAEATFGFWVEDDGFVQGDRELEWVLSAAGYRDAHVVLRVRDALRSPERVVINEVLADPPGSRAEDWEGDANGDGVRDSAADEFVELVNGSLGVVDLSGWTLSDSTSARHVFSEGTILQPGLALVVFGGGEPVGNRNEALAVRASTGRLGLNNAGDSVVLADAAGKVVDEISYGPEGDAGQSLNRDPDVTGLELVEHSWATGGEGRVFSPGHRTDGRPFGDPGPHEEEGFAEWTAEWFPEGGVTAQPDADFDADGLANLIEYALGLNPRQWETGVVAGGVNGAGEFQIAWRGGAAIPEDVELEVQISRDLGATGWEFVEEGMGYEVIEDGSGSGEGRVLRMLVKTGEREMLFVRLVARRGGEG